MITWEVRTLRGVEAWHHCRACAQRDADAFLGLYGERATVTAYVRGRPVITAGRWSHYPRRDGGRATRPMQAVCR